MFEREKGRVSVWIGQRIAQQVFQDYAVAEHGDIDKDEPLNDFCKDAGDGWFDHDFVTAVCSQQDEPVAELLKGYPDADFFTNDVVRAAKKKKITLGNAVVLMYDSNLSPARWPKRSPLTFVGNFRYTDAKPIVKPPKRAKGDYEGVCLRVSISPDGSVCLTECLKVIKDRIYDARLWNLTTGKLAAQTEIRGTLETWIPESKQFVVKDGKRGFSLWRANARSLVKKKDLPTDYRVEACLSHDHSSLVWVERKPVLGNFASWSPEPIKESKSRPDSIGALPGNRLVGAYLPKKGNKWEYRVWDLETSKLINKFSLVSGAGSILGCRDDNDVITSNGVLDVVLGRAVARTARPFQHRCLTVRFDGGRYLVGDIRTTYEGRISVSSLDSLDHERTIEVKEINFVAEFAAESGLAVTGSYDANVRLWDLRTGDCLSTWSEAPADRCVEANLDDGDGWEIVAVAISDDGKTIVASEHSGRILILHNVQGNLQRIR